MDACTCWWDSESRGGVYSEIVVEVDPECPEHGPEVFPCGHPRKVDGCGGCDPGAIEFVVTDDGVTRPFDPVRDMEIPDA